MIRSGAGRVCVVFISLGLLVTACSTSDTSCNLPAIDQDAEYRLGVGDQLRVTVFGQEDLSGEFEVNSAGQVSMPLVGDLRVLDRTISDVDAMIVAALAPEYLQNPVVSVEILVYRDFFILGEVANPGPFPYRGRMTVITGVAMAGGFTYRAVTDEFVITRDGNTFCGRKETAVLPGDVIEIRERYF